MMRLVDQTNHPVELSFSPKRIISLVPSQTELLSYLNLEGEVVGITKFCIHPQEWFNSKARIGGTKNADLEKINALKPDLIIANKEENTKEDIEYLRLRYPVYTSDIISKDSAFKMIEDVGLLTDKQKESGALLKHLKHDFEQLPKLSGTVLYLIWRQPFMAVGKHTFINSMLEIIGLTNAFTKSDRYDEVSIEDIQQLAPDYIFLSSEPYPFKKKHMIELEEKNNSKVLLVDGEMFSWYGSRLMKFNHYIQAELAPMMAL